MRAAGLWFYPDSAPAYAETVDIDLGAIALSLAGPRRPQDLVAPGELPTLLGGPGLRTPGIPARPVALAAITSCTNTSDPRQLPAAWPVARKPPAFGMTLPGDRDNGGLATRLAIKVVSVGLRCRTKKNTS